MVPLNRTQRTAAVNHAANHVDLDSVIQTPTPDPKPQVRGHPSQITRQITEEITMIFKRVIQNPYPQVSESRTKSRPQITHPLPFRGGA